MLRDPAAGAPAAWVPNAPGRITVGGSDESADRAPAPPHPPYWLVRSWRGAEPDEIGRSIVERAIHLSRLASQADHDTAVAVIADALCRWAHPDDIRWCHLPDAGTGGYTVVGTAICGVSQIEGCSPDDEDLS